MKVLVAPNAFKDSLSGLQAANAIAEGILKALPNADIQKIPVADGGDGLTEIVLEALGGQKKEVKVADPLGRPVQSVYCYVPSQHLAVIEMAEASGLRLLEPPDRNPMLTSTFGTGQLIKAALDQGATKILVGLGGSATNDGGIGMASALGATFIDKSGTPLTAIGKNLDQIADFDLGNLDKPGLFPA